MVDFAGWSMPVQYASIVAEHNATRAAVGLFDVSHMGRLRFDGPGRGRFLDSHRHAPRRRHAARPDPLRAGHQRRRRHSRRRAGLSPATTPRARPYYQLVVNASNRQKICGLARSASRRRRRRPCRRHARHGHDRRARSAGLGTRAAAGRDRRWPRLQYYHGAETDIAGRARHRQPHRLHGRRRLRADRAGRRVRCEVWEQADRRGRAARRHGRRPGLPRHAAARSRHAAVRPRADRSRSIRSRPAWASPSISKTATFPGRDALAEAARRHSRCRAASAGCSPASACRAKATPSGRRRSQSATSPAARSRPRSSKPIAMGYVRPELAAPGTRTDDRHSRHRRSRPASCHCRFIVEHA